tara:strand:- start:3 stop:797 length:795 start_codon:yes stop_codon:yes gene_type:complete
MKRFTPFINEAYTDMLSLANFINNIPHEEPWATAYHDQLVSQGKGQVISNANDDKWTTDIGVPKSDAEGFPLLDPNDPDSGVPWWDHPAYMEGETIDGVDTVPDAAPSGISSKVWELIKEQYGLRKKPNHSGGVETLIGGGHGGAEGNYEYPFQNEGPGDSPEDREDWAEYWEWLSNLEVPGGPVDPVDPIDVQLFSKKPELEGSIEIEYDDQPIRPPNTNVTLDRTPNEELGDPSLFDDPYSYAGVTNDYGMLRKKNINFNEI